MLWLVSGQSGVRALWIVEGECGSDLDSAYSVSLLKKRSVTHRTATLNQS